MQTQYRNLKNLRSAELLYQVKLEVDLDILHHANSADCSHTWQNDSFRIPS